MLELIEWAALSVQNRQYRRQHAVQEHTNIYQALKENDSDSAYAAMESHLVISKKLAQKQLKGERPVSVPSTNGLSQNK